MVHSIQERNAKIFELSNEGLIFSQIAERMMLPRGTVARVVWHWRYPERAKRSAKLHNAKCYDRLKRADAV